MLAFRPLKSFLSKPLILKQGIPSNLRLLKFENPTEFDEKLMASLENNSQFWEIQNAKFTNYQKSMQEFHRENREIYLAYNKRVWIETGELIYAGLKTDLTGFKKFVEHNFTILAGRIRVLILLSFGAGLGLPFVLIK